MKVVHIINSLQPGGAETLLANSLAPGGLQEHTDNVVVYFQGTSALEGRIDKSVPVHSLGYKGLASLPQTLLKLRKIIKSHKADLVHSHLNPAGFYTHLVCPVPQVHTLHTTYSMDTVTRPAQLFLEKELYFKKKDCNIILLSDFLREDFLRSVPFRGKSFVLNNFIADNFFNALSPVPAAGPLKMVAAGRLTGVKNFEYLLEVFKYLKGREISLDIYGGGDPVPYEKIIAGNNLKITLKGHIDSMHTVLNHYDLYIMPSTFEGFPLSAFEAMAARVPVMLSDIPPLKNIVKDNAIYFPLDDPKAVADTIMNIESNKTGTGEMAKKAHAHAISTVKRDAYLQRLLVIYQDILQPNKNNHT